MAELVGILGDTGSGKTYALRNLDLETSVILGVVRKPLSFKGWKKNMKPLTPEGGDYLFPKAGAIQKYSILMKVLKDLDKNPKVKTIIIDDFQYLMSNEFMERASEVGYKKFSEMAGNVYLLLMQCLGMRDDIKIFIMSHDEVTEEKDLSQKRKIKTIGRLLDEKITLEGLFTVVLFTEVYEDSDMEDGHGYRFVTKTDGVTRAKSPSGMFNLHEPNDVQALIDKMDAYYEGDD